jgi:hypothetical protein
MISSQPADEVFKEKTPAVTVSISVRNGLIIYHLEMQL